MFEIIQNFKSLDNFQITPIKMKNDFIFLPQELGNQLDYEDLSNTIRTSDSFKENIEYLVLKDDKLKAFKEVLNLNNSIASPFESLKFAGSLIVLTEVGLYTAIFLSRKPDAQVFRRWVAGEVLPSIRKHGIYATPITVDQMLANPDYAIELLMKYKEERNARLKAEQERLWISSKREATAMATASMAIRKLEKANEKVKILNEELGQTSRGATILKVAKTLGVNEKSFNWRKLKNATLKVGLEVSRIDDPRFGSACVYPAEAWLDVYNIDLEGLFEE